MATGASRTRRPARRGGGRAAATPSGRRAHRAAAARSRLGPRRAERDGRCSTGRARRDRRAQRGRPDRRARGRRAARARAQARVRRRPGRCWRSTRPAPDGATVGGVVAAGDSGPLRHRYGAAARPRLGVTVALADGTRRQAGGKVIKNVAGYDLAKLFAGSFGTLGVIVEVAVRLHPLSAPDGDRRAGRATTPTRLAARGRRARPPRRSRPRRSTSPGAAARGAVLARFARRGRGRAGRGAAPSAARARPRAEVIEDDDAAVGSASARRSARPRASWCASRACPPSSPSVLRAADGCGGALVGRAALGHLLAARCPAAPEPSRRAARARCTPRAVRGARRARGRARARRPVGRRPTAGRARADAAGQGALRPAPALQPGVFVGGI